MLSFWHWATKRFSSCSFQRTALTSNSALFLSNKINYICPKTTPAVLLLTLLATQFRIRINIPPTDTMYFAYNFYIDFFCLFLCPFFFIRLLSFSLQAEAPFPLYSLSWRTGRKATSAMGRNSLWFNRRPWSWTAVFETHAPCIVCWPRLEPTLSRAFLYSYSAVI